MASENHVEESTTEPVRRLVTVQRIVNLEPIEGKDRIELASILGYKCVVKKGEFRINQLCAFHEVDSFVPTAGAKARPCYAFLNDKAKDCPNEVELVPPDGGAPEMVRRARIRTMKMGGVYSQGLALSILDVLGAGVTVAEGEDITALTGVTKYEPGNGGLPGVSGPRGKGLRPWPSFAPSKTDEERLQSNPGLLQEIVGQVCYVTGKIDGSSMTVIKRHDGSVHVCSRNFEVVPVEGEALDIFNRAVRELGIADKLKPGYALQGELAGPGIQKNRAGYPTLRFCVFNVYRYFDDDSVPELLPFKKAKGFVQDCGLQFVPVLWSGWLVSRDRQPTDEIPNPERHDLAFFIGRALAQTYPNGNAAEGIVVRPETPMESKVLRNRRLSFKVINPQYETLT